VLPRCAAVGVSRVRALRLGALHAASRPHGRSARADRPCLPAWFCSTIAALSLSVASSVSLVIVNKYLISTLMFPYGARSRLRAPPARGVG
jgi:hypothetical protein